jgi:hypothetical protein
VGTLTPADLKFSRVADDLVVRMASATTTTGDELSIQNHFAPAGADGSLQGIDKVVFGNGVTWSRSDIASNLVGLPPVSLTEGNDNYQGTAGGDVIFGEVTPMLGNWRTASFSGVTAANSESTNQQRLAA